jgi:glycerate kinase
MKQDQNPTVPLRVLIAPDSFKGTLTAREAAAAIAEGWASARPADTLELVPLADGGEGTLDAIEAATPGVIRRALDDVTGLDGRSRTGECRRS